MPRNADILPALGKGKHSSSHILQWCPVTHYQRIQRYDRATKDLSDNLNQKYDTRDAPSVHTRDNRYIPDLLVIDKDDRTGCLIETTVVWEHKSSLLYAAKIKKDKYNRSEILENIRLKYNLLENPTVLPFVIGARGGWRPSNDIIWKKYNLPNHLKRIIVCNAMHYGSYIHRTFITHTWRMRKKKK